MTKIPMDFFQHKKTANSPLWMALTLVLAIVFMGIFVGTSASQIQPQTASQRPKNTTGNPSKPQLIQHVLVTFIHDAADPNQKQRLQLFLNSLRHPQTGLQSTVVAEKWIDAKSAEGRAILQAIDAKYLPVAFFDTTIEQHPQFPALQKYMHKVGDRYVVRLHPLEMLQLPSFAGRPFRGAAPLKAKVTMLEYGTYTCRSCRQMEQTFARIMHDDPEVTLLYQNYDGGGADEILEQGAECANEQQKFWSLHDQLFQDQEKLLGRSFLNQNEAESGALKFLQAEAQKIGLANDQFKQCLASGKYQQSLQQKATEAAKYGIETMPAFFIGNKFYSAPLSYDELKKVIESEKKS